ncbi:flagellar export protein FliJ [bacterium]|nr:flagellar export protein FliJ [bacterium]
MFRFRLERVLRHRQRQVDARSRDVADAERVLRQAEAAVQEAREAIAVQNEAAARQRSGPVDVSGLQRDLAWQDTLHRELENTLERADRAREDLAAARARLEAAWRDREVLEKLRERQREEWRREEARRQQREIDEVASIRAALGAGPEGAVDGRPGDETRQT